MARSLKAGSDGTTTTAIIVTTVILAVIAVVTFTWWCMKRRRRRKQAAKELSDPALAFNMGCGDMMLARNPLASGDHQFLTNGHHPQHDGSYQAPSLEHVPLSVNASGPSMAWLDDEDRATRASHFPGANSAHSFSLVYPPAALVMAQHVNSLAVSGQLDPVDEPSQHTLAGGNSVAAFSATATESLGGSCRSEGVSIAKLRKALQDTQASSFFGPDTAKDTVPAEDEPGQPAGAHEVLVSGNMVWAKGELLGKGSYGKVYAGLNQQTGELMAVKVVAMLPTGGTVQADPLHRQAQLRELQQELALYKSLRHRHVVKYIDSHFDPSGGGSLSIFLEYVPGGSVSAMLSRFGHFGEDVVRSYTWQLLMGLEYLHERGIVHRDLKGGNALVSREGIVKLADFGSSRAADREASIPDHGIKSLRGSVYWMAPEVIMGTGYGRPADVWSLGCTVIEMMTARHPWPPSDNAWTAMFQITNGRLGPPRPPGASPMALDFLNYCLRFDATLRPTASELLNHPFVGGKGMRSFASDAGSRVSSDDSLSKSCESASLGDWRAVQKGGLAGTADGDAGLHHGTSGGLPAELEECEGAGQDLLVPHAVMAVMASTADAAGASTSQPVTQGPL